MKQFATLLVLLFLSSAFACDTGDCPEETSSYSFTQTPFTAPTVESHKTETKSESKGYYIYYEEPYNPPVDQGGYEYPPQEESKCPFTPDFSTKETSLRSAILLGNRYRAAEILGCDNVFSLGAGLTYPDELACRVVRTANRTNDPDIVAIQALALSAEWTGDTAKLAYLTVYSFDYRTDCYKCPLYTPQDLDEMYINIKATFDSPEERQFILDYTGEGEFPVESLRKLFATETSPTNSFYCAYCDPGRTCNKNVRWCPKQSG